MTEPILQLDGLIKRFDALTVLKGITAEVRRGDVVGLLGLNGSGKTTLLETALGFALPDEGAARLFGQSASALADEKLKHRIGFVPQQDELLDHFKGGDFLNLIGKFYPRWNPALIQRLAQSWDVPLHRRIAQLSVGQRQKLSILAALGHEPELLILDEPVASLDPLARRKFLQELIDIVSDGSRTILFSTHIVSDLERVASRVWILKDGRLAIDETLDALKEQAERADLTAAGGSAVVGRGGAGQSLEEIFLELHQ
jgi:ABC-2 type transport system ATP-binding protein